MTTKRRGSTTVVTLHWTYQCVVNCPVPHNFHQPLLWHSAITRTSGGSSAVPLSVSLARTRLPVIMLLRTLLVLLSVLLFSFSTTAFPLLRRHDPSFLYSSPSPPLDEPAPTQYISQPLDHFSPTPTHTFLQRYWINSTLFTPGSPVFLSLGGEGPDSPTSVSSHSGLSYYSLYFHAMIVSLEHRFYGESVPFNDVSTPNLQYLTSQQSLADAAALIHNLTVSIPLPPNTPWIVFGGSYAGALSAWMKFTYPELVLGSIASSAPIRAIVDFSEYLQVVEEGLGADCSGIIRTSTQLVEALMSFPAQRQFLLRVFNQCPPLRGDDLAMVSEKDRSMFFNNILGPITALVQYNTNYRPINISTACAFLQSQTAQGNALTALAAFNAWYNTAENGTYPFATGASCQNTSYANYVYQTMQLNSPDRQWYWQSCNEVGFFQTAARGSAFSSRYLTLSFFSEMCADVFRSTFDLHENVNATNTHYQSFAFTSNQTVFTNGLIDPWHVRSLLTPVDISGVDNRIDVIGPTSHCQDLAYPRATDIDDLQQARWRNVGSINGWLGGAPLPSSTGGSGEGSSTGEAGGGGASKSSMSNGALVGIVVFVMVVAVGIGGAGVWYWKKGRFARSGGGGDGGSGAFDSSLLTGHSSLLGNEGGRGTS